MSAVVSILDELRVALAAPTPEQDQELIDLGVPALITNFVGAANIRPSDGLYEPDPNGMPAWIIPIIDGEVVDLLAWTTDCPARWWTRTGAHWALGADALDRLWLGKPLRAFKTPLAWLQAGAPYNGLVILDWRAARLHIPRVEIVAEDLAHGLELNRLLTIPAQHPLIHVPESCTA